MSGTWYDPIIINDEQEPNLERSLELSPRRRATVMNHSQALSQQPPAPILFELPPAYDDDWIYVRLVLNREQFLLLLIALYLVMYLAQLFA